MFVWFWYLQLLADFNLLERIAQAFEDNKNQPYVTLQMLMLSFLLPTAVCVRSLCCRHQQSALRIFFSLY